MRAFVVVDVLEPRGFVADLVQVAEGAHVQHLFLEGPVEPLGVRVLGGLGGGDAGKLWPISIARLSRLWSSITLKTLYFRAVLVSCSRQMSVTFRPPSCCLRMAAIWESLNLLVRMRGLLGTGGS